MADNLITGTTILEKESKTLKTLSISPADFVSENPDSDDVTIRTNRATDNAGGATFNTGIFLPQGAVVISCIMYGNAGAADEDWALTRSPFDGTTETMGTAGIKDADIDIDYGTIDNDNYTYSIGTSALGNGDEIYGVKIVYNA